MSKCWCDSPRHRTHLGLHCSKPCRLPAPDPEVRVGLVPLRPLPIQAAVHTPTSTGVTPALPQLFPHVCVPLVQGHWPHLNKDPLTPVRPCPNQRHLQIGSWSGPWVLGLQHPNFGGTQIHPHPCSPKAECPPGDLAPRTHLGISKHLGSR